MGIKITGKAVARVISVALVILTLFFDWLYVDKLTEHWVIYRDIPSLLKLYMIGLVGYSVLNLVVAMGVKWTWT
jgi:hypothetical protein